MIRVPLSWAAAGAEAKTRARASPIVRVDGVRRTRVMVVLPALGSLRDAVRSERSSHPVAASSLLRLHRANIGNTAYSVPTGAFHLMGGVGRAPGAIPTRN